ncbi:hypothetical protein [Bradyrhizobium yuanmingense]|uniref:hypothetical protein n=1 Tax=Bradyrhizobium yuanmingense TaxID=108015 RepID=UPI0023B8F6CD|nr:hypothetical protein [Bradyrhizobium yuanmingense]MDF0495738.1 hypothetical protein [Bradyrhizobium yuanmingense]
MGEISRIAAVRVAGGESEPFYSAKLRVFYWDSGTHSDQIVKDVAGLRVLLADADAVPVEHGGIDHVHLPLMLRGYVRPQEDGGGENHGVELRLIGQGTTFAGTLVAAAPTNDVTLVPIGGWPQKLGPDIEVPELRLTAGVVPVALAVDGQPLQKFLKLATKNNQSTLFGGFRLEKLATNVLPLTLVPYGIELEGSLPDPTRDLLDAPDAAARIRGRFRLERRPSQDGKPQYWLRLIGGHPDAPQAMAQLEARIARAFGDLATQKQSPLAIRFDRRPGVPPLLWPLSTTPNGLALTETAPGEFKMAIESSAIDARLRTFSNFPGDVPGIAAIHGEHIEWKKLADGFDVEISAGSSTAGAPKVVIQFANGNDTWTTSLDDTFETQPIEVPLDTTAARLLAAYKSGHVVAATDARAPYAFLPLTDGWLQLGLATARREKLPEPTPATRLPPSAISGRIVAAHGTTADGLRGIVVDEAVRLILTMRWRKQNTAYRPASGTLDIRGARGQLRGFVFVAETAPTAAEALPDLRRGPATTRDLPIAFNAPQIGLVLRGTFKWKPTEWALHVTDVLEVLPPDSKLGPSPGDLLGGYGWQVPHDRPFITNHPLTRTAVTPAEPSVSRSLLRYAFEGGFTLANAPGSEAPLLTVEKAQVQDVKPVSFAPDTLVLTTLPGPEFLPQQWPRKKGQFTAALRHDLPVLDELFAWADPPPPKSAPAPTSVPQPDGLVVTALAPARLEEVWRQNRVRMALTYTQDAFMTGWIATGADDHQDVTTLVQPYRWKNVPVKIDLAPRWGAYQLDGDTYRLDTALAGLRGEFDVDVANGQLKTKGKAITVRGNAASLFRLAGSDLVWDSRGTGLGAVASNGARPVGLDGKQRGVLRTLGEPQHIEIDATIPWMKAARLVFHVRDLPIEGKVFDGAVNPVESAPGTVGQAFDRANFPAALHEWRLMEEAKAPAATSRPKPFDLRFGPFLFRPSRLLRVELDGNDAVQVIKVIGTLRIGKRLKDDEASEPEAGPFGADRIYERADLFCLTLKRQGNTWTPAWEGISLKHVKGPPPKLEFVSRAPEISCAIPLDVDTGKGIPSANQARIDATIVLDIASRKVRLGARLFGRDCDLESKATIGAKIEFAFESADTAAAASEVLLRIDAIAVTLAENSQSIRIDGALQVMPEKTTAPDKPGEPDKAAALVHVGREKGAFRWLDLPPADTVKRFNLSIDHASGRVGVEWIGVWTQARPLFGLEALGGWEVQARLQVFVASAEPLQKLAPVAAASAWGRIAGLAKGTTNRIDHRLRSDADSTAHHVDMTWEVGFTNPVSWPVNGLRKADGSALPDAWRSPKDADSKKAGRSRKIRIVAGDKLVHAVKVRFRSHRIDAKDLNRLGKRITPRVQLPLLVEVKHTLAGNQRSVTFTTLDHVAITSLKLMIDEGQSYGFAPRYPGRLYRGRDTQAKVPHPGLVQLPWAVSGFFDEALIRRYATLDTHLQAPLFLGGSAALFPYWAGAEQRAVTAVVPWAGLDASLFNDFGTLNQAGGQWEVAAPDLWGGTANIGPSAQRTMAVASGSEAAKVLSAIGDASLVLPREKAALARVMPIEQLFFENLRQGSNGQLESSADIEAAPFFLRALMAIEARWNAMLSANDKQTTWRALSLHPAQGDKGGTRADPVVGIEIKPSPPRPADSSNLVPADLVALSARSSAREFAYRLVPADRADDAGDLAPRAELIARARDLDRFAECAIREVDREGGMPGITVVEIPDPRMFRSRRGGIATDHPVLAPSPSLGWPSAEEIDGLDKLAPRLGAERPVQSAEAGFAARFRQIGLPGRTTSAMSYLGFNHRVVYQRDLNVPFEGPAARHLSPVNTRLRAPIDEALGTPADTGPILPPYFELATVGRRPGVVEVVTAAVTVAVNEKEFDPAHARFGRPATSGPVVAHQLRTPRSPALPDDVADIGIAGNESDVLKFRRRTYLSLADGSRAGDTKPYILRSFGVFAESTDVVRREKNDEHLRVALSLTDVPDAPPAAAGLLGPHWDGLLAIKLDAVIANIKNPAAKSDDVAALKDLIAIHTVRLEIGAASFVMKDKTAPVEPKFTWVLSVADQLPAARDAVRRATVDVPIRLVITFGHVDPLSPAPRLKATLPLALDPGDRRVLRSRTRTVAFGDPSYDRQLGSTAEGDIKDVGGSRALLSVDREEYDPGATLYFACDTIDPVSGLFATDPNDPLPIFKVRLRRFGQSGPDGTAPAPEKLFVAGGPKAGDSGDGYELPRRAPYELPLRLLRRVSAGVDSVSPLGPGDRLEISAELTNGGETKMLTVVVNIIAAPVIAPPPCVYSVIESAAGAQDASRVVLHAAAPLPQHIEHPELRNDLAKGYVKRRALFVWRFASVGAEAGEIELVKYDRSGGAQLPDAT